MSGDKTPDLGVLFKTALNRTKQADANVEAVKRAEDALAILRRETREYEISTCEACASLEAAAASYEFMRYLGVDYWVVYVDKLGTRTARLVPARVLAIE